ncbi:MAG: phosphoribulokinase [Methanolinea sp.]|jgi:phosphoribulokinase|nr:phosphoribulokinase [Methanolinea sp.]
MKRTPPLLSALNASDSVYVIGVAGDSGSGKTTFASAIRHLLGDDLVSTISLDDYHLYDRKERKKRGITPLSPDANDFNRLEEDVTRLRRRLPIRKMVYDHSTGTITGPYPFHPARILILEGLHAFFTENLRRLCDFTLFVDPDPDVKKEWKFKRDTGARGYTEKEVREELAQRASDYSLYVAPQRRHATVVIGISFSRFGRNLGWEENIYRVTLSLSPWDHYPPGASLSFDFRSTLTSHGRPFSLFFRPAESRDGTAGSFELDGMLPCTCFGSLAAFLEETTGRDPENLLQDCRMLTPTAFTRLFVCGCIVAHMLSLADTGTDS